MKLEDKLKNLPASTGVYIMKDAKHKVVYVGKARNIKNRVRHYFQRNKDNRLYTAYLVRHIADIDFVLTDTEKEALILENNLIKQFKPRFNINLRDDKTFVSIKIDIKKKYPYPMVVRQIGDDGALYFGPYASARAVRETLRYIHDTIPIRKCPDNVFKKRVKPCLYYQIHKCMAPCCGLIDEAVYGELLKQVILILKGKQDDLVKILKKQMHEESNAMRYERAAKIRDRIKAIEETLEKQRIHSVSFVDRDVFGYYAVKNDVYIQVMFIRLGNMEDVASYHLYKNQNNIEEVFRSFLNQFYSQTRFIPSEIIIPVKSEDSKLLEEWLSERKGKRMEVICPVRGDKVRLVEMAQKNAENAYLVSRTQEDFTRTLYSLKEGLKLNNIPECIECFDISNIFGKQAVGSMVVFEQGKPNKSKYKRFKIKTVKQIDDYAMMREVLTRRYKRAVEEGDLPDLVIVDGGRGQLSIALKVFEELAVGNVDTFDGAKPRFLNRGKKRRSVSTLSIPRASDRGVEWVDLIALAKGKTEGYKSGAKAAEHVFKPDVSKPIVLDSSSPELLFLERVRDEAHRFAVTFHRKLRDREYYKSPLNEIIGIGTIRKKLLMKCFGSIEGIRNATIEQLIEISKLPPKLANDVFSHFHKTNTV